mmetsp:Transcript_19959/g.61741  ORF Transcript_19959/g.61741 Transcript_19959/m.61741 type:complete len:382 (+) Transcript_19959:2-1147(+)
MRASMLASSLWWVVLSLRCASALRQLVSTRRLKLFEDGATTHATLKAPVTPELLPKLRFAKHVLGVSDATGLFEAVPEFKAAPLVTIASNHAFLRRSGAAFGSALSFADIRRELLGGKKRVRTPERDAVVLAFRRGGLFAAKHGDVQSLKDLLDHGYSPSLDRDRRGASCLHWSAGHGHAACCDALYERRTTTVDDRDGAGATPLHWAVAGVQNNAFGVGFRAETADVLVSQFHADVRATTTDGNSVFHWACWAGGVEAMRFLLERGADARTANVRGCAAAHWAAAGGDVASLQLLHALLGDEPLRKPNRAGHTPLSHAVAHHRADAVRFFLDAGIVDVDAVRYAHDIAHLVRQSHDATREASSTIIATSLARAFGAVPAI